MAITGLEMADLVREVCHDGGTGPLLLGGAVPGYRGFDGSIGEGAAFPYAILGVAHPAEWECGVGGLDAEGRLVRTPVASSAGGAAVDFAVGEKLVVLTPHAGWLAAVEAHGHDLGEISGLAAALAGKQAASAVLGALAGLEPVADRLAYWSDDATAALTALSGAGRALIGGADAGAMRDTLGLGIGSDVQAHDAGLDAIAALATSGFGRGTLVQGDAAAMRAYIGAGTSSTTGTVTSVAGSGGTTGLTMDGGPVTGAGTLTLGGTLGLAHGGTGATTAAGARGALGLGSVATLNSGTSGAAVPLLNGTNSWSATQAFAGATCSGNMVAGATSSLSALSLSETGMTPRMQVQGTTSATGGMMAHVVSGTAASAPYVILAKQRATTNIVQAGERLGVVQFAGHDGVALRAAGAIVCDAAAPFSSGNAYGAIKLLITDGVGAPAESLRVDAASGVSVNAVLQPMSDNARTLGTAVNRWSVVYAATGTINTSDARAKCDVAAADDALLDAWGDVQWVTYRWRDAVAAKGDGARVHVGLMAQGVRDAIDARLGEGAAVRLGLLCRDDLPDGEVRWGLRYDQCLALEAAWQRRRLDRIEAQIEARIEAMIGGGDGAG